MACELIISFQKIYGLCGLKGHIVEIRGGVTLVDGRTDDEQRNVKIGLEFWKQNSQLKVGTTSGTTYISLTRPCTTMRDSENIHEQSSLQN